VHAGARDKVSPHRRLLGKHASSNADSVSRKRKYNIQTSDLEQKNWGSCYLSLTSILSIRSPPIRAISARTASLFSSVVSSSSSASLPSS
jgi:hypothetical protein